MPRFSHSKIIFAAYCVLQMGYGSRALQALNSFYSGEYFNLDEAPTIEQLYPDPALVDLVCI
jgi:hypothetical protein